jgi:hypothetical protein
MIGTYGPPTDGIQSLDYIPCMNTQISLNVKDLILDFVLMSYFFSDKN